MNRAPVHVKVTLSVENTARRAGLLAEHGLSWFVQWGDRAVLFDTGQGMALPWNAPRLDLDLARVTDVVLSHGHYDHTGGLSAVLASGARPRLFAHPAAWAQRYSRQGTGPAREIGMPREVRAALDKVGHEATATVGPTEVLPGLFATGEVPRLPQEQEGHPFFLDAEGTRPDPLLDDQAMFFDTEAGLVVLLGCAHAGVIATLRHVQALCGGRRLHLVAGGMHLEGASQARLAWTLEALAALAPDQVAPLHCTGAVAQHHLRAHLGERCSFPSVGSTWTFAPAGAGG